MPSPPRPILLLILAISLVCGLTSLAGVALGFIGSAWFVLAFEVVTLAASVMGVLTGLGRFNDAPALAALCAGGCVFVAALLAEPTFAARLIQGDAGDSQVIAGVRLLPWAVARIAAGALLISLSALIVLIRRPRASLPLFLRGLAFLAIPAASLAALTFPGIRRSLDSLPGELLTALAIAGFFLFATLVSIALQHLIRAFEVAIDDESAAPVSLPRSPEKP